MGEHVIVFHDLERQSAQFVFRGLRGFDKFRLCDFSETGLTRRNLKAWDR